jgi:TatD DNase family protein
MEPQDPSHLQTLHIHSTLVVNQFFPFSFFFLSLLIPSVEMEFVDIGANLTDSMYHGIYHGKTHHDEDLHLVLKRSHSMGMRHIIITSGTLRDTSEALEIVDRFHGMEDTPVLSTTVGVHPTRGKELLLGGEKYQSEMLNYALNCQSQHRDRPSDIICWGECGLDYDRLKFCGIRDQRAAFAIQLALLEEEVIPKRRLPVFLHSRNAADDFIEMISAKREVVCGHGVVHSFTGSREEMQKLVDLDLWIGLNGCSFKTDENLEIAKHVPLDRLLLETDAPWCGIRKSHASSAFVSPKSKMQAKPKHRFEMGMMVKDRNEPCCILFVIHLMHYALYIIHAMNDISYAHSLSV